MLMPRTPGMLYTLSRSLRDGSSKPSAGLAEAARSRSPNGERRLARVRRQPLPNFAWILPVGGPHVALKRPNP
jgi:hypothetical protein